MKPTLIAPSKQRGSMLLESLIAILLFSVGILAIVGLQAAAVKNSADAKYRADAALLANQLIGQMWVGDHSQLTTNYTSPGVGTQAGPLYNAWIPNVQATLPGIAASTYPSVTISQSPASNGVITNTVTIIMYWKMPSDPANAQPHKYTTIAQIV